MSVQSEGQSTRHKLGGCDQPPIGQHAEVRVGEARRHVIIERDLTAEILEAPVELKQQMRRRVRA